MGAGEASWATVDSSKITKANWFSTMMCTPQSRTSDTLHVFTMWSALLAYLLNGLLGVIFNELLSAMLFMKLTGRDKLYWRITCALLTVIGFLYVVMARSRPLITGNGAILGTVPERLFFVVPVLAWLCYQSLVSLPFAAAFSLLDSGFAIITYIIWYRNTPQASLKNCLVEIGKLMIPILGPEKKWASNIVQIIGYLEIVISVTLMAKPDIARELMGLDAFQGFSKGILSLFFMQVAVIGWLQVLGGGDGNEACPIAAVFYRIAWKVPFVSLMYYFNDLERGFTLAVTVADLASASAILISLCIEALPSKKDN
ncbi:hypothetical protein AWC38_SpisGene24999 [Stylophora pistillata]|uniref:Uncharacterized protein n=1 Tax=Stylophora pistillata TaxID=50429 RepID=A0A2B4R3G2_STYPI|nr:hypothetical protein AWC38_SpisGene24999 [Stylophora pistillata]